MIKVFVMDVDGTLTDGSIYYGSNGEVIKKFNVLDGYGINKLLKHNIIPVIISGRKSEIVYKRFSEIGVNEIHLGINDKLSILREIQIKYNINYENFAYVGDDENDLAAMRQVGYSYAVKNSIDEIKQISVFVSSRLGGYGAVREIIDYILKKQTD